jgi:hypothetical protein
MGWQTWLNLDAISAQPTANLYGLMDTKHTKDLGFINALNAVELALRIKPNQPILKNQ